MSLARGLSPPPTSQFTYRHLTQLAASSPTSPLRVVAHIDLDAFYAQCEMRRLDLPDDQPLAVQQWQGLIAINYPARKFGISRMATVAEAKKKCPDLVAQHVATWREGDTKWAYRDDAAAHIATDKVSLDPYRLESRKILSIIKASLPPDLQRVEKGSIDEVFLELSAQVHAILLGRFPELAARPPEADLTEHLPLPELGLLDWQSDSLIPLDEDDERAAALEERRVIDWDDVAMLVGSEIVRHVRARVWQELHYTCSAGIARNKLLSKLGSGHHKPNGQTVVRNHAVPPFLSSFKFTKIRMLGGKLGDQVASTFETESVKELLLIPLGQMKAKLGEETGIWLYNTIRGVDTSEVSSRTQIKSMLSAKSFRPSVTTETQASKWLRIFAADIHARLVDEGLLEHNRRRPRTINLHYRHAQQTRSRQGPIPQGKQIDEDLLFELAKGLLGQVIADGGGAKIWPCSHLSLNVGGFDDGITGNMGIDGFLVKGEEASPARVDIRDSATAHKPATARLGPAIPAPMVDQATKRRKVNEDGIRRFLLNKESMAIGSPGNESATVGSDVELSSRGRSETASGQNNRRADPDADPSSGSLPSEHAAARHGTTSFRQSPITQFVCSRCDVNFESPEALQNHNDWHFAKDLQDQDARERGSSAFAPRDPAVAGRAAPSRASDSRGQATTSRRGRRGGGSSTKPSKVDHGQSTLKFV